MNQKVKLSMYVTWLQIDGNKYIYSTKSGAIVKVDNKTEQLLRDIRMINEVEDEAQRIYLLEKGILVPEHTDEFGTYRFFSMAEQYDPSPATISFTIAVTEACNYHCRYCFESTNMHGKEMTEDTISAVVAFLKQTIESSYGLENLRLTWFGGEPLLQTNTIKAISLPIIEYCGNKGIHYSASIITNGSLVTDETLELFQKIKIGFVQITLDGDASDSLIYKGCSIDAYKNSISGILKIAKTTRINVRLNTDGKNMNSILKTVKRIRANALSLGVAENIHFYLAAIDSPGESMIPRWFVNAHKHFLEFLSNEGMKDDILLALPEARYTSCGAVTNAFGFIGADGKIVKCEHHFGKDEKMIGTVFDGFWHNTEEAIFRDTTVPKKCVDCSYYPICRQGCLAKRLEEHGHMDCKAFKENVQNILINYLKT